MGFYFLIFVASVKQVKVNTSADIAVRMHPLFGQTVVTGVIGTTEIALYKFSN